MALEQRIESLKKRHADLEHIIHQESCHPAHDDLMLHGLKRQKLELKDEMMRLMSHQQAA